MSDECCARTREECEIDCDVYVKQLKQQLSEAVEVIEEIKRTESLTWSGDSVEKFLAKYRGRK